MGRDGVDGWVSSVELRLIKNVISDKINNDFFNIFKLINVPKKKL